MKKYLLLTLAFMFAPIAAFADDAAISGVTATLTDLEVGATSTLEVGFTASSYSSSNLTIVFASALGEYEDSGFDFSSASIDTVNSTLPTNGGTVATATLTNDAVGIVFNQPNLTDGDYVLVIEGLVNSSTAGDYRLGLSSSIYDSPGDVIDVTSTAGKLTLVAVGAGEDDIPVDPDADPDADPGADPDADPDADPGAGDGGEGSGGTDGKDGVIDWENLPEVGTGDTTGDTVTSLGKVTKLTRLKRHRVKVTYATGETKTFRLFGTGGAKVKVQLHTGVDVLIAINKTRIRTFNAYTGARISQKKLFKKKQYRSKFKRYNAYKKKSRNSVIVLTRAKVSQKGRAKMRSFVVTNKGKIRKRTAVNIELPKKTAKFSKLKIGKNKKFGKKARFFIKRNGNKLATRYWITKKKGAVKTK